MSDPVKWQQEADRLANEDPGVDEPTAWFDKLYRGAADGAVTMPWDHDAPNALLAPWLADRVEGHGRGVVVGCGLGAEAEYLVSLGYETTGFDVSPTAVELARQRHPGSSVDFRQADLFDLPPEWRRGFDLVVEIFTVQALPHEHRTVMTAAVRDLVAEGGTLVVIQSRRDDTDNDLSGPPWPLTRGEVEAFAADGLSLVALESVPVPDDPEILRWRGEFRRTPTAG